MPHDPVPAVHDLENSWEKSIQPQVEREKMGTRSRESLRTVCAGLSAEGVPTKVSRLLLFLILFLLPKNGAGQGDGGGFG